MNTKLITPSEAVVLAKKEVGISITKPTIIKFIVEHDLGYQLGKGGRWYIYRDNFMRFIRGKNKSTKN